MALCSNRRKIKKSKRDVEDSVKLLVIFTTINAEWVTRDQNIELLVIMCVCVFRPAPSEGWDPSVSK